MRAQVLTAQAPIDAAPLQLRELPDPLPGPGEVRVRVRACGLCRTDLHVIEGDLPPAKLPLIPGHQVVGIVDALGTGASRFARGDRVGIAWLRYTDGDCPFCRRGEENLCPRSRYTGWHADGGFAERALIHESFAYRIPDRFADDEAAPLLCAGIIGWRALARSRLPDGGRLGLFGFGSSAHLVQQLAQARGARVFVSTRAERHRQLASALGAVWTGESDALPPEPLDSAILFAPVGSLVPRALRALRKGGTLVVAGIYLTALPELTYEPHLFHEKTLTSVEANTRADGEALLAEAALIPLLPRRQCFAFTDANRALRTLAHDGLDGTGVLLL